MTPMDASLDLDRRMTFLLDPDDRRTIEYAWSRTCTCGASSSGEASFCGMCGRRLQARRPSLTGSVIDDLYAVEELLAEGGFAAVYRARYLPTGLEVAVKVLHSDLASDARVVERFRREARRLLRLRDRHTVATYDWGETADGTHYIVMEMLRGENLLERLRAARRLPWREVMRIMSAVCSSLREAHAHGVVHRDLKPANIHLGDDDVVKVIDFGLAKLYGGGDEDLTLAGQTVGTQQYMAPEQLVGAPCDSRSDIYALGIVAYEAIVGRRPFAHASTPEHLADALFSETPPRASAQRSHGEVPADVDALLERCLAPEPDDRFANVDELAAEIDSILARHVSTPRPARVFPHTPAFELEPPRIVLEPPEVEEVHPARHAFGASLLWFLSVVASGVGLGSAVAQFI